MNTNVRIAGVDFKNPVTTASEPLALVWNIANMWICPV